MSKIVDIVRIESFSAAHRLNNSDWGEAKNLEQFGKCNTLHGHNYKIEVKVRGYVKKETGMVINISDLKRLISEVLVKLDHQNLNEIIYFQANNIPTTAENLVCYIFEKLRDKLNEFDSTVKLHSLVLHETEKNIVKYKG